MTQRPHVRLKPGKERKLNNGYPWVQRGEVESAEAADGTVVRIISSEGDFVAVGTYNSQSRFPVRVFSLSDEELTEAWFEAKFRQAMQLRSLVTGTNARRVLFAEADGVPGLIADDFDGHLVVQVRALGTERLRQAWLPAVQKVFKPKSIYERSDMLGRAEESLPQIKAQIAGETPDQVWIEEDGLNICVPIHNGLKTGYYLDQRNSRRLLAKSVNRGDKVLDCFCYSGGFSLHASRAGGICYAVDISELAVETARKNVSANGLEFPVIQANAFDFLEEGAGALGPYDWIILDPPAIAKTAEKHDSLKWAIWKLVHSSLPMLKPGGRLVVCSCSYQLSIKDIGETCRLAASDRGERLMVEQITLQDVDHPAPLSFPEGLYLKCLWLRKS